MTNGIYELIDELVSDLACCDRNGCRCFEAVLNLEKIKDYCEAEINKAKQHLGGTCP